MIVGSVVQALRIVRHLADAAQPEGVNAIARRLAISPSSCFNLLKTLVVEEFLRFDESSKTYSIGPALSRLARRADDADAALLIARPQMEAIAAQFRLASGLWRLSSDRLVLVAFANSELATRLHMTLGQRLPKLVGAIGRCVAAHATMPDKAFAEEFVSLRWERAPSFARYRKEIAAVQERGWAFDDGDFMRGLATIAAPILDADGVVRYCIANTLFQGQHGDRLVRQIGQATAGLACNLAERLYGRPKLGR